MGLTVPLLAFMGMAMSGAAWADKVDTATVYDRGTVARLGIDVQSGAFHVLIGHAEWKSLEEGKIYAVRTVFDGVKTYRGEMKGQRVGSVTFLAHGTSAASS